MTIENINIDHAKQGGVQQLASMRDRLLTLEEIANHFNVSKTRVAQWMEEIFGEKYDPREARKQKEITDIATLIKKHGVKKTKEIYPSVNKFYFRDAIKLSKK